MIHTPQSRAERTEVGREGGGHLLACLDVRQQPRDLFIRFAQLPLADEQ